MISVATEPKDTKLSSTITISAYRQLEQSQDREGIATFLQERFTERYITPLTGKNKHGFSLMAISCLMIESLESFYQGWKNSGGKSKTAFLSFFERQHKKPLGVFNEHATEFYTHVRCGILHQGETTGGWHIRRRDTLFEPVTRTINATRFHAELDQCLTNYCEALRQAEWDDDLWQKARLKMKAVYENCAPSSKP